MSLVQFQVVPQKGKGESFSSLFFHSLCELLSNCIFTGFFDNLTKQLFNIWAVVNCFQIVFLLGSLTTTNQCGYICASLWIAFKLYFYWVLWQHKLKSLLSFVGCELLSNCIFTGFFDNAGENTPIKEAVVNCFQIVFLLGSLTTISSKAISKPGLWIAFKLYFYWVLWQPTQTTAISSMGCELLSNCIFTGFFDNSIKAL